MRFNFDYNDEVIKIYKLFFRSKNLSFNNNSKIILKPFLEIETRFEIEDINSDIFNIINLDKFLNQKIPLKNLI